MYVMDFAKTFILGDNSFINMCYMKICVGYDCISKSPPRLTQWSLVYEAINLAAHNIKVMKDEYT